MSLKNKTILSKSDPLTELAFRDHFYFMRKQIENTKISDLFLNLAGCQGRAQDLLQLLHGFYFGRNVKKLKIDYAFNVVGDSDLKSIVDEVFGPYDDHSRMPIPDLPHIINF